MAKKNEAAVLVQLLGPFEQLVLTAVMNLGKNAYGVPIHAKVSELAGRNVNSGSIYVTLERLTDKGLLSSSWSEGTAERGGRPKHFYHLEGAGLRALQESIELSSRISETFEESWRVGKWKAKRAKG